jgi:hypothetical protein
MKAIIILFLVINSKIVEIFGFLNKNVLKSGRVKIEISSIETNNPFDKISSALDNQTQKLGQNYGQLFEREIQNQLNIAGYTNFFKTVNKEVSSIVISATGGKSIAEMDALVVGSIDNFHLFQAQFLNSYVGYPPSKTESRHTLFVEAKLNSDLLKDWTLDQKNTGSRNLFFDPIYKNFSKVVCINGGKKSEEFVYNMHLENPAEDYVECINLLKTANINVFYKLWASGETFQDIFNENKEIKEENKEIKEELKKTKHLVE